MSEPSPPTITVLTPAYRRTDPLERLYESLLAQTYRDFEWIVVDDGSGEEVGRLVESWVAAGEIDVVYRWQENRGKHVAVNRGVELARGEFTTIIDDDDRFVENALERLLHHWREMPEEERQGFSGVIGLCVFEDGTLVGDRFPSDPFDCDPVELAYVYKVAGDKHGLLRTEVLREFPYPFETMRGFVVDALVWNRMALKYRERHVNEVVTVKDYRADGITARERSLLIRSAPATSQFFLEESQLPHPLTLRKRARSYANYARYSLHAGRGLVEQSRAVRSKVAWAAALPVGAVVYAADRVRLARANGR